MKDHTSRANIHDSYHYARVMLTGPRVGMDGSLSLSLSLSLCLRAGVCAYVCWEMLFCYWYQSAYDSRWNFCLHDISLTSGWTLNHLHVTSEELITALCPSPHFQWCLICMFMCKWGSSISSKWKRTENFKQKRACRCEKCTYRKCEQR